MSTHQEKDIQLASYKLKIKFLEAESARFAERYQDIVAKFYQAQADYAKSVQQCADLHQVVQAKQQAIELLLPFYSSPRSLELQRAIDLPSGLAA